MEASAIGSGNDDLVSQALRGLGGMGLGQPKARRTAEAAREYQRRYMATKRAAGRDVAIPAIRDEKRRRRYERKPCEWVRFYLPVRFSDPFSSDQREVFMELVAAARGEFQKKALACPRGFGKTTLCLGVAIYAIAVGLRTYPVIVEAKGTFANTTRLDFMTDWETSTSLCDDYPEIVAPIRALQGAPQRARSMTYQGQPVHLRWSGDFLLFPTIPGSRAAGTIFSTATIEGAIRGLLWQGKRPDLLIINDPQTRESASSLIQTEQRRNTIDMDVRFLENPQRPLTQFYIGTIFRLSDLTDEYTDPEKRPSWQGRRIKFVKTMPDRRDLWDRYIELFRLGAMKGDKSGREAHAAYLADRKAMDAGAAVSNKRAFSKRILDDGSQLESSALEHFFRAVADVGWDAANTELQNEPPSESQAQTSGLTMGHVQLALSHVPRATAPAGTEALVGFIDVGGRSLHWVVGAILGSALQVIDYGEERVLSPLSGSLLSEENREALDSAIGAALATWRDGVAANPFPGDGGGPLDLVLIDSGWRPDPVYRFCRECADRGMMGALFHPSKGLGTSKGQNPYRAPPKRTGDRKPGDHWFGSKQRFPGHPSMWLWNLDADYWKRQVHEGFLLAPGQPGSISLFGDEPTLHRGYAEHIMAEEWIGEFITGKGVHEHWRVTSPHNHKLDGTAGLLAARAMLGVSQMPRARPNAPPRPGVRRQAPGGAVRLSDKQKAGR